MRFQRTFVKSAVGLAGGQIPRAQAEGGELWIWETEGRRRRWSRKKRRDWSNFRRWSSRQYRGPYGGRGRGYGSIKSIQKYGFFLSFRTSPFKTTSERSNELGNVHVYPSYGFARFCLCVCASWKEYRSIPYFNPPLSKLSRDVPHDPLSQIKIGIEKGAARSEVFFFRLHGFFFPFLFLFPP